MGYDAVLFDHDGALVNVTTQATHLAGARAAFDAVGVDDPNERAGIDSVFIRRPHRADTDLSVTPDYEVDGLAAVSELL